MDKYKNYNKGYYWILISVEILSRYAFAIEIYIFSVYSFSAWLNSALHVCILGFLLLYLQLADIFATWQFYNIDISWLTN